MISMSYTCYSLPYFDFFLKHSNFKAEYAESEWNNVAEKMTATLTKVF